MIDPKRFVQMRGPLHWVILLARKKASLKEHIEYHKDGSVRARGMMDGDELTGYWEWFRKDGSKLRSGHFEKGEQVGEWVTYDQAGKVYKVTKIKPKPD